MTVVKPRAASQHPVREPLGEPTADNVPVARSAQGANDIAWTPKGRNALLVAPFAYQPYFGEDAYRPVVKDLESEDYSVTVLQNTTLSDTPTVSIERFIAAARHADVIVFFGHSATGALPLDVYRSSGELIRRVGDWEWLNQFPQLFGSNNHNQVGDLTDWFNKGYVTIGVVDNESNLRVDKHFPPIAFDAALTPSGISHLVTLDAQPFVWMTSCEGASLRGGFQAAGARGFYGYIKKIDIVGTGAPDLERFWADIVGRADVDSSAPNNRLTSNAYGDCQAYGGCKDAELWSADGSMTLAPAVTSIEPDPEKMPSVEPGEPFPVQVVFDAHMHKASANGVVSVQGCGVKPAPGSQLEWTDDHTIGGRFVITTFGQLTIAVNAVSATSDDGQTKLDGNDSGASGLAGGVLRADDFVWHVQCGALSVRGLDPSLVCSSIAVGCVHGPPAPFPCDDPLTWSQFAVSAQGLDPNTSYDLTLGGTAHGVTENKSIGTITTDGSGDVSGQTFSLPDIPAHDPWTLTATPTPGTATPSGGGQPATTTLETGELDCVAMLAGGGGFQSLITAVGLTPDSPFSEIVDGTTAATVQADADGTVPPTTVSGSCAAGQVQVQLNGYWLDHGSFSDDATDGVDQYC
jgi:hypothetical protein